MPVYRSYGNFNDSDGIRKSREWLLNFIKKSLSYGYKATPLYAYKFYFKKGGRIPYEVLEKKYYNPDGWKKEPFRKSIYKKRK